MYFKLPKSVKTAEQAKAHAKSLCTCTQKSFIGVSWMSNSGVLFQLNWDQIEGLKR